MDTPTAPTARTVTVRDGTAQAIVAQCTLTFDGIIGDDPTLIIYSDLSLPGYWERYEDRLMTVLHVLHRLNITPR